jgi:hypothetical protein
MNQCRVTQLWIYPIKSLGGVALERARVTAKGLAGDRRWMLINPKGQFVSQRQLPQLSLIKPQLTADGIRLTHLERDSELEIPYHSTPSAERLTANIWHCRVSVMDEGDRIGRWITEAAQSPYPLRLVRMADGYLREVDQSSKLGVGASPVITEFADGFPFLITNEQSLNQLNRYLQQPIPMDRFRPNIVVAGPEAFAEHNIQALKNSQLEFALKYPCERCIVTTIDQKTGVKHPGQEPLTTLRRLNPMPNAVNAAAFGENASLELGDGSDIQLGDLLEAVPKESAASSGHF